MTLDGTNTWILAEPGAVRAVVVDPGPLHEGHLQAVLAAAERRGSRVGLVLLTHGHADHAEGAARLATLAGGVPVRALDPAHRLGPEGLGDGDVGAGGGLGGVGGAAPRPTPGRPVLGGGTPAFAGPNGKLADYLDSLRRLRFLAESGRVSTVLPGHGPVL